MRFTLADLADGLTNSSDPAFAVDGAGRIIVWNPAAEVALGYSQQHTVGRLCHEVIRGKDVFGNLMCHCECLVRRNIRENKPSRRFQIHVRASDGHHVEAECATLCVRHSPKDMAILHMLRLGPSGSAVAASGQDGADERSLPRRGTALTDRQQEVLKLLASGKNTREMAEELYISPGTVRTHVENILHKLEVHSRLEAVIVASREGLI